MKYYIFVGEHSCTLSEDENPPQYLIHKEEHAKTIEARDWDDANIQYHEFMGWEPYVVPDKWPEDDEC